MWAVQLLDLLMSLIGYKAVYLSLLLESSPSASFC